MWQPLGIDPVHVSSLSCQCSAMDLKPLDNHQSSQFFILHRYLNATPSTCPVCAARTLLGIDQDQKSL